MATYACHTREVFERERRFLIGHGIPASFLPDQIDDEYRAA
ncbi:hypothetical protein AB0D67_06340 [Streptosporangium sp. NPDC048047]